MTLSWDSPSKLGIVNGKEGSITAYTVYYSENDITDTTDLATLNNKDAGTQTTTNIENCTNGTRYYFVVTAKNATGEGAKSSEVTAITIANSVPDPVRKVEATPGDTKVTIKWYAPLHPGIYDGKDGIITAYTVYYSENSINDTTDLATLNKVEVEGTQRSVEITGLTNGVLYYFAITVTTGAGEGGIYKTNMRLS